MNQIEAFRLVLWWENPSSPHAFEPGSFFGSLIRAWARADTVNSAKLRSSFPEIGSAIDVLRTRGCEALEKEIQAHEQAVKK